MIRESHGFGPTIDAGGLGGCEGRGIPRLPAMSRFGGPAGNQKPVRSTCARCVFGFLDNRRDSDRIRRRSYPTSMRGGFGGEPTAEGGREHPPRFAEQFVRRVTRCASCVKLTCEFTIFDRPPPTTTDHHPNGLHARTPRTCITHMHYAHALRTCITHAYRNAPCVCSAHMRAEARDPSASRVCVRLWVRARV